jgi:hypothetical protein
VTCYNWLFSPNYAKQALEARGVSEVVRLVVDEKDPNDYVLAKIQKMDQLTVTNREYVSRSIGFLNERGVGFHIASRSTDVEVDCEYDACASFYFSLTRPHPAPTQMDKSSRLSAEAWCRSSTSTSTGTSS